MRHYFFRCGNCGAPAADCVVLCPYCGHATGFSKSGTPGIEKMKDGGVLITKGAHVEVGASEAERECPFCGASTQTEAKFCGHCKSKIVIERMRFARLIIDGGSMSIGSGGKVEVLGRCTRDIHRAAASGDLATVKAAVEDGDDPDYQNEKGRRPIHFAAGAGRLDVAKWLVSVGAEVDPKDDAGARPIDLAAQASKPELVSFFEMMGARARS